MKKIETFAPVCGLNDIDVTLNYKIKTLIAYKEKTFLKDLEFLIVLKITEIIPNAPIAIEMFEIPKHVILT